MSLTRLIDVEWSMGVYDARLHPVGILEPVRVSMGCGSVTAKRVDLYSWQFIKREGIQIGEIISVIAAGEVLVNFEAVATLVDWTGRSERLKEWNGEPVTRKPVKRPKRCLRCGGPLKTLTRTAEAIACHLGGNVESFGPRLHGVHRCAGVCGKGQPRFMDEGHKHRRVPAFMQAFSESEREAMRGMGFDELVSLPGIGPGKARRIIEMRDQDGQIRK